MRYIYLEEDNFHCIDGVCFYEKDGKLVKWEDYGKQIIEDGYFVELIPSKEAPPFLGLL